MTIFSWLQIGLYLLILLLLVKPLGAYMAHVYQGERTLLTPVLQPLENFVYRILGIKSDEEMNWKTYALALLLLNFAGILVLYALQRFQFLLPLNPLNLGAVQPDLAFNTAVSFATNTNWQSYAGETTMSYFIQNGRPYRAEFSFRRRRPGNAGGTGTRLCQALRCYNW